EVCDQDASGDEHSDDPADDAEQNSRRAGRLLAAAARALASRFIDRLFVVGHTGHIATILAPYLAASEMVGDGKNEPATGAIDVNGHRGTPMRILVTDNFTTPAPVCKKSAFNCRRPQRERVTGKPLSNGPFLDGLREKFGELYGL